MQQRIQVVDNYIPIYEFEATRTRLKDREREGKREMNILFCHFKIT